MNKEEVRRKKFSVKNEELHFELLGHKRNHKNDSIIYNLRVGGVS